MLFIRELNPELNTQKHSIGTKLFTRLRANTVLHHRDVFFFLLFFSGHTFIVVPDFIHFWLDNDVKRTSKRRRLFKNFLNQDGFNIFYFIAMFYSQIVQQICFFYANILFLISDLKRGKIDTCMYTPTGIYKIFYWSWIFFLIFTYMPPNVSGANNRAEKSRQVDFSVFCSSCISTSLGNVIEYIMAVNTSAFSYHFLNHIQIFHGG